MAQVTEVHTSPNARVIVGAKSLAIPITTVLSAGTLLELLSLNGVRRVWASFLLSVHALNAFAVQAKFHPDGAYVTIASAAGDYTSPGGIIVGASGDLTSLSAANGWISVDTTGLCGLRIQASSASASGTLCDMYANGSS